MAQHNLIAAPVRHVCEHIAAMGCVHAGQLYLEHFGLDVRQWPLAAVALFLAVIYAAGLMTSKFVRRRFLSSRRPLLETPAFTSKAITPTNGLAVTVVGTMLIVGAILLWRIGIPPRRNLS